MKRPSKRLPLVAAAALQFSLACNGGSPAACPGVRVGDFSLQTAAVPGEATCGFEPEPRPIRAALSWESADAGTATLCPEGTHATPLIGEHAGDHVTLTISAQGAPLDACGSACTASIDQRVEVDVLRDSSGAAIGLQGSLLESISAPSDDCAGSGGSACTFPCEIPYTLVGTP